MFYVYYTRQLNPHHTPWDIFIVSKVSSFFHGRIRDSKDFQNSQSWKNLERNWFTEEEQVRNIYTKGASPFLQLHCLGFPFQMYKCCNNRLTGKKNLTELTWFCLSFLDKFQITELQFSVFIDNIHFHCNKNVNGN